MAIHPSPAELVLAALEREQRPAAGRLADHLRDCAQCRRELAGHRAAVRALRLGAPEGAPADACLDDVEIARVLDGADPDRDRRSISHLAACARCRAELAAASRLLSDALVAAEVDRLETVVPDQARRRSRLGLAATLAAAGLAALLLVPRAAQRELPEPSGEGTYRERTLTNAAAPRIVGPREPVAGEDSLRWTSVVGADLYRLTFWRPDGSVVWEGQTRDTVLALPAELARSGERTLLWDVKARTGWDRWVVSELVELRLGPPEGNP